MGAKEAVPSPPRTADATAFKIVSEPTRERETYKYDPSLLTAIKYNDDGAPIPSAELVTSYDAVLTALCQLGACRLGTARSLISLFDKSYQYIVAEATPTMPLLPGLKHEDRDEDLWLCGTAIPRRHGVCEYTLCVSDPDQFEDGRDPSKLPLALVADLTADPRFMSKPYCRPGTPARFYAAVPIRTHRGINIGVYCVIHTEPRMTTDWDAKSTEVLRDISGAIMDHLEQRRSSSIHARSDRMTRGMGSFVEGKETLSIWRRDPAAPDLDHKRHSTRSEHVGSPKKLVDGDDEAVSQDSPTRSSESSAPSGVMYEAQPVPSKPKLEVKPSSPQLPPTDDQEGLEQPKAASGYTAPKQTTVQDIFCRAANILRESIDAEGFLFLDASVGSFGVLSARPGDSSDTLSQSPSAASSEEAKMSASDDGPGLPCRVLGYSASEYASQGTNRSISAQHAAVPQKFLNKLLRRYPRGKIFNFDEVGDLQSSDTSGDEGASPTSRIPGDGARSSDGDESVSVTATQRQRSPWTRRHEGSMIRTTFPGARSVAFVPVWDAKKDRWFAGGFAYTYKTTRIFTIDGELSYLRAFAMLTMEESFRLETQLSDRAKADVLHSISHELRSPLHGIVLAVELLHDTQLDVFQGNIMHTLETCSRTLLDTVDHLLDFSKISNYATRMKMRRYAVTSRGVSRHRGRSDGKGLRSLSSHVRLDVLIEEVLESVFAGFNFQHISLSQLATQQKSPKRHADVRANRRLDSMRAMEELGPSQTETGELRLMFGKVSIFLDIDPAVSWAFRTQPGAIRRIVMNLFGNSLKYTAQGTILVSIDLDTSVTSRGKLKMVNITVSDTGKGISEDYLRHELFRPFSQEDHLAPGTGLGLSLVRQIVGQLKGTISVESRVGYGTTVSVSLPLLPAASSEAIIRPNPPPDPINGLMTMPLRPSSSHSGGLSLLIPPSVQPASVATSEEDTEFLQALSELAGRTVRLVGFRGYNKGEESEGAGGRKLNDYRLVEKICQGWFQMTIVTDSENGESVQPPDLVLCMDEALGNKAAGLGGLGVTPAVVICANALLAYQRSSSAEYGEAVGVFEFVSQPTGPKKLAKALSLALRRGRERESRQSPKASDPSEFSVASPLALEVTSSLAAAILPPEQAGDASAASTPKAIASLNATLVSSLQLPAKAPSLKLPSPFQSPRDEEPAFLLVDDNHINLKILSSYTKKIGRKYTTATNGVEAVEAFTHAPPGRYKCVFMDISMPVMDGFEATRKIRAYEEERGLERAAVFALSGLASASAQQEAFSAGIDLFLTKPVRLKELGAILEARGLL